MIIELITGINRILGYFDISSKYLNRTYSILALFPTAYILRIVYGQYANSNYVQFGLYLAMFLILMYFAVLNIIYYFFDKNVRWDITQWLIKVLPEDIFNVQSEKKMVGGEITLENVQEVEILYTKNINIILSQFVEVLKENKEIPVNTDGFEIPKNTLYPYYEVEKTDTGHDLLLGTSYSNLEKVGEITTPEINTLGLFLQGGYYFMENVRYKEPYKLKLLAKKDLPRVIENIENIESTEKELD